MTRLAILLVVCEGVAFGAHALANQSGLDPDVAENIPVGLTYTLVASCSILAASISRLLNQNKLSRRILFSFFFYSWRNSFYNHTHLTLPINVEAWNRNMFWAFFIFIRRCYVLIPE